MDEYRIAVFRTYYMERNNENHAYPDLVDFRIEDKLTGFSTRKTLMLEKMMTAKGLKNEFPFLPSDAKKLTKLVESLREELAKAVRNHRCEIGSWYDRMGWVVKANGGNAFLRGGEMISLLPTEFAVPDELKGIHLAGAEMDANAVLECLSRCPKRVLLVLAYVVLASIRSVLLANGVDLQAVLYIVGPKGQGKTSRMRPVCTPSSPTAIPRLGITPASTSAWRRAT